MKYQKPSLTFEEQAQLLLTRGLVAEKEHLVDILSRVNYYRLGCYLWDFYERAPGGLPKKPERLLPRTTLGTVWRRYTFDRHLRLLVLDGIERVEVAVLRTRMVEQHTRLHGPCGYREKCHFMVSFSEHKPDGKEKPGETELWSEAQRLLEETAHEKMLREMDEESAHSQEEFVDKFREKYPHEPLPLWIAVELACFGTLVRFFKNQLFAERETLAKGLGLPYRVLESWLLTLNTVRNFCAHHVRLWDRQLRLPLAMPKPKGEKQAGWEVFQKGVSNGSDTRSIYAILTILRYLLRHIAPESGWEGRLRELLKKYPDIPKEKMGFPAGWQTSPLWQ